MRLAAMMSLLLLGLPAAAETPSGEGAKGDEPERKLDPDEGRPKPDPDDLRAGHVLISARGGIWVPSVPFTPRIPGLGRFDAAGTVGLKLGVGLNRYLVLGLEGGYGRLLGADESCVDCYADSFDAGASLAFFIAQGFAFEPWASYGIGYRRTTLSLAPQPDLTYDGLEFVRLAVGGSYFPTSSFGFGPYVSTDVGFRNFEAPTFYAAFGTGMRLTFDPLRLGTAVRPQVAGR